MIDCDFNIEEEIEAIRTFKETGKGLVSRELLLPSPPREIRQKLGLTRQAFAALLGVSKRTLDHWEQGKRQPQGPAIALLRIAENNPEVFISLPTAH
ncbi:MAG: helix-turn-helix domain-containing protein [Leptolyngbya sp. SIOISBB]|nr:helix-turn-helix domain-containing protein [Leptolyngbya sp. SIOISBB]